MCVAECVTVCVVVCVAVLTSIIAVGLAYQHQPLYCHQHIQMCVCIAVRVAVGAAMQ